MAWGNEVKVLRIEMQDLQMVHLGHIEMILEANGSLAPHISIVGYPTDFKVLKMRFDEKDPWITSHSLKDTRKSLGFLMS
ncbi:hypothetical protein J1N35_037564 [Gossypium stocksii]|uniref:Uncharacterized protein n=1 Tax=Gossypium stocksii TaxID=47602 RepID=A0A9D3UK35_9ROSI|nr:hypothetical protein J1N35_037564 [Gossypium stocksii]